jgi:hypothetical protein
MTPTPHYVQGGEKKDAALHQPILKSSAWQGSAVQVRSAQLLERFTSLTPDEAKAAV